MKKLITLLLIIGIVSACSHRKNKETITKENTTEVVKKFPYPNIPALYTDSYERALFLLEHFWDNIDFKDTITVYEEGLLEQSWVNYFDMLKRYPDNSHEQIKTLYLKIDQGNKRNFDQFLEYAEKYLYFANSPFRDDELYLPICEAIIEGNQLSDAEKSRYAFRLEAISKNSLHTKAENLTITLNNNKTIKLHQIKSEYIILFFNNPECNICAQTLEEFKESKLINNLIKTKRLKVVSVCPDNDYEEWKRHTKEYPTEWINGYDADLTITTSNLYDLRAIPSLYLLNKDKVVLVKDSPSDIILNKLQELTQ